MPRRVPRAIASQPPPLPLPPLDMRLLAELPSLSLQARCMVEGFLSGHHRSPQKGSSVEFAEYRAYQPGDDLRRVDWRLYGRTDRLHVKQYEEETQLRVFVVLDTSGSMDFQSREKVMRKIEFARIVIAALALLARRQGDAFGLGIAGAELRGFLSARSSVSHWRSFIGKLEVVSPAGKASLATALLDLAEVVPPRSMIVIASDFYEETPRLENALRRLRYDHHDLIGAHVLDPVELDFDLDHSGTFVDAESPGWRLKLDAPSVRRGYLERFGEFCSELDELFHEAGGEMVRLRTDRAPFEALSLYLAQREQRL
ncbi:MAG: DUF58 domain-containing protein [Terrimicrobiaceae bacterium]